MNHLFEKRDALVAEMESLALVGELTDEQRSRFDAAEAELARVTRTIKQAEARNSAPAPVAAAPAAQVPAIVTGEQRTEPGHRFEVVEPDHYGRHGSRSWFGDVVKAQRFGDAGAEKRLREHAQLEASRNEKRSVNAWRGQPSDMETRAGGPAGVIPTAGYESRGLVSSTDSAGGYLTPPADLQELYVEERKNAAIAAGLVTNLPLPDGVQLIRLPKLSTSTSAAIHTQGNTISKTDGVFGQVTSNVYRLAGGQDIANFLLERGNPAVDVLIMNDLAGEIAELLDTLVLHGTNSSQPKGITKHAELGSKTVTYDDASPTYPELYPKFVKAIGNVAANVKRYPTDALMAPRRVAWIQGALDSSNRPILGAFAPMNALGSQLTAAAAGIRTNIAGVDVSTDGNMRTNRGAGTDEDDIIVGYFPDAILWTAPVMFGVSREEKFSSDQTVVKVAQDMSFMPDRRADSFYVVQGTGLNAVL